MRGAVSLQGVSKAYGEVAAVRDLSLEVRAGERLCLLGPSGCGKTTLLRLIAGLSSPDAGRVVVSGADVTAVPPHRRPVNTVFQHYALFPHRSVEGNVSFGLEMAGRPAPERAERIARALDLVRLGGLGSRSVDQLSGGQKQRVALARALVLEPEVLLLDEPMSALDRKLRLEMRGELKALHARLGTTFVFVTHDQEEALSLGDRVAVMSQGRLEQLGTPQQIYERPRTLFVAEFMGVGNVLQAEVEGLGAGHARLRTRAGLKLLAADDGGFVPGATVWVGIRPERIGVGGSGPNRLTGRVEEETYRGDRTERRVRVGEHMLTVAGDGSGGGGAEVTVAFPAEAVIRLEGG